MGNFFSMFFGYFLFSLYLKMENSSQVLRVKLEWWWWSSKWSETEQLFPSEKREINENAEQSWSSFNGCSVSCEDLYSWIVLFTIERQHKSDAEGGKYFISSIFPLSCFVEFILSHFYCFCVSRFFFWCKTNFISIFASQMRMGARPITMSQQGEKKNVGKKSRNYRSSSAVISG